jgi:hypothetical protein
MRRFLLRLVFTRDLGRLAPWVLGLALGRWPRKVIPDRPTSTPGTGSLPPS